MNFFEELKQYDEELYAACDRELGRQRDHIELIASENFVSEAVMSAMGSHLTNRLGRGRRIEEVAGSCSGPSFLSVSCREYSISQIYQQL